MFLYLLLIVSTLSMLYLGFLAYNKNPNKKDNQYFLFLVVWISVWFVASFFENEKISDWLRSAFLYVDFLSAIFFAYYWFMFSFHFLENKTMNKYFSLAYLVSVFVMVFAVSANLVFFNIDTSQRLIGFSTNVLFPLYAVYIIFSTIGGSLLLIFKYHRLSRQKKGRVLVVIMGFLIPALLGVVIVLLSQNSVSIELFRLGSFAPTIFVLFTGYAIFKHGWFDVKSLIQKSIIYSLLLALIVCFYLLIISFVGVFAQALSETKALLAGIVTTVIGIYSVPVIEKYFRRVTDKFFYKDKYDYSQALYEISEILNKNIDIEILHNKIEEKLKNVLKLKQVDLVVLNDHSTKKLNTVPCLLNANFVEFVDKYANKILICSDFDVLLKEYKTIKGTKSGCGDIEKARSCCKKKNVEVVVLVKHDNKYLGVIVLGPKKSGDIYSYDDLNLLKTFSSQAAVAFEKAQLFEQVNSYSRDLEKKVKKRTRKIKDMQEHQKQMMLEIAHGLQTPLTIIRGKLETLPDAARKNMKVSSLDSTIDRISKFIYDMLRLSNLESGEKKIKKDKIDMSDLMEELVENFEVISAEKGIKIKSKIAAKINISGDKNEIADLVTNLVSNSTKYMKTEGEKTIEIVLEKKGNCALLTVKDNGVGIDKKHIPYLFTRFHRIEDKEHAMSKGTGLGLAICKKIVERHKGTISVSSESGKGASFSVVIPSL